MTDLELLQQQSLRHIVDDHVTTIATRDDAPSIGRIGDTSEVRVGHGCVVCARANNTSSLNVLASFDQTVHLMLFAIPEQELSIQGRDAHLFAIRTPRDIEHIRATTDLLRFATLRDGPESHGLIPTRRHELGNDHALTAQRVHGEIDVEIGNVLIPLELYHWPLVPVQDIEQSPTVQCPNIDRIAIRITDRACSDELTGGIHRDTAKLHWLRRGHDAEVAIANQIECAHSAVHTATDEHLSLGRELHACDGTGVLCAEW